METRSKALLQRRSKEKSSQQTMPSAMKDASKENRAESPSDEKKCAICLGPLTNRSLTCSCPHEFCFECLLEWSKVKAECPLCKTVFRSIIHNIRSDSDYDEYVVPLPRDSFPMPFFHVDEVVSDPILNRNIDIFLRGLTDIGPSRIPEISYATVRPRSTAQELLRVDTGGPMIYTSMVAHLSSAINRSRRSRPSSERCRNTRISISSFNPAILRGFEARRRVYERGCRVHPFHSSLVVGSIFFRSVEYIQTHPSSIVRIREWLTREISVLCCATDQRNNMAIILRRILSWMEVYEIKSSELKAQLRAYFGRKTGHFQHEFYYFVLSGMRVEEYDQVAYYPRSNSSGVGGSFSRRRNRSPELVIIDSDSDDGSNSNIPTNGGGGASGYRNADSSRQQAQCQMDEASTSNGSAIPLNEVMTIDDASDLEESSSFHSGHLNAPQTQESQLTSSTDCSVYSSPIVRGLCSHNEEHPRVVPERSLVDDDFPILNMRENRKKKPASNSSKDSKMNDNGRGNTQEARSERDSTRAPKEDTRLTQEVPSSDDSCLNDIGVIAAMDNRIRNDCSQLEDNDIEIVCLSSGNSSPDPYFNARAPDSIVETTTSSMSTAPSSSMTSAFEDEQPCCSSSLLNVVPKPSQINGTISDMSEDEDCQFVCMQPIQKKPPLDVITIESSEDEGQDTKKTEMTERLLQSFVSRQFIPSTNSTRKPYQFIVRETIGLVMFYRWYYQHGDPTPDEQFFKLVKMFLSIPNVDGTTPDNFNVIEEGTGGGSRESVNLENHKRCKKRKKRGERNSKMSERKENSNSQDEKTYLSTYMKHRNKPFKKRKVYLSENDGSSESDVEKVPNSSNVKSFTRSAAKGNFKRAEAPAVSYSSSEESDSIETIVEQIERLQRQLDRRQSKEVRPAVDSMTSDHESMEPSTSSRFDGTSNVSGEGASTSASVRACMSALNGSSMSAPSLNGYELTDWDGEAGHSVPTMENYEGMTAEEEKKNGVEAMDLSSLSSSSNLSSSTKSTDGLECSGESEGE